MRRVLLLIACLALAAQGWGATTDARPVPRKNVAFRVTFPILDADGDLVTAAGSLDSESSCDGGTFSDLTSEATELATSSGMYYLELTAGEMNCDTVAVIVKSTSGKTTPLVLYPEEAGDYRADMVQISGDSTAADNAEAVFDNTGYSMSNSTMGTVTTCTTASTCTSVTGLAAGAIGVGDFATGAITADAIATDAVGAAEAGFLTDSTGFQGADIAAILVDTGTTLQAEVDGIQADTEDLQTQIGTAGAGLTAVPWNASWDAEVQSEVNDELVLQRLDELLAADSDIDGVAPPTVGSVFHEALTKTAGSFTYDQTTDSPEALRDRGDAAWITYAGDGSGFSAIPWNAAWDAEVESEVDDALGVGGADLTAVPWNAAWDAEVESEVDDSLGGGTGTALTAIPWNASWDAEVESEANDALVDEHLDHLFAADYDPASKPGTATALLNELVENDGGVSRFTANALEQAPSAGTNPNVLVDTTIATRTSQTVFTLTAGPDTVDGMDNSTVVVYDASDSDEPSATHKISSYTPATREVTLDSSPAFTTVAGDGVKIFVTPPGTTAPTAAQVADAVWDEAKADHTTSTTFGDLATDLDAVLADTNELQGAQNWDVWDDAARTLTAATNITDDGGVINVTGGAIDTVTTNTDMRGTDSAALAATALSNVTWTDARAGYLDELGAANMPADLDAVLTDTSAYDSDAEYAAAIWNAATVSYGGAGTYGQAAEDTVADTNELQTDDVPGLIAALNNLSAADVAGELATYDGPTNAEMEARTLVAASYFDPAADTVANVTTVGSVSGAVGSVTGNVGGTINGLTATALADLFDTDSGTDYSSSVSGSVVKEIADNAGGGSCPTAAQIATAMFTQDSGETYSSAVSGSVVKETADNAGGSALTEAGIADAVWDELSTGHTGAGKAGEQLWTDVDAILGDTSALSGVDVTVSSPVAESSAVTVVIGDDYLAADGRELSWDLTGAPSMTGASIEFKVSRGGTAALTVAGAVTDADTVYVELTDTQTATLSETQYTYHVRATLASGSVTTVVQGILDAAVTP